MENSELLFERNGTVAMVTFNRPEARNAITWAMYDGLVEGCEQVDRDETIRVVVFRGAGGKAFAAFASVGNRALEFEGKFGEGDVADDGNAENGSLGAGSTLFELVDGPKGIWFDGGNDGLLLNPATGCV